MEAVAPEVIAPGTLRGRPLAGATCAVIDVLRASTTILCLLERGAAEVRVVGSLAAARRLAGRGWRVVAERGGRPVPGLGQDNSPHLALAGGLRGERVAITTSHGTRALLACRGAAEVVVAGLRNLGATARRLARPGRAGAVLLVPAGSRGGRAPEDDLCALALGTLIAGGAIDSAALIRRVRLAVESRFVERGRGYVRDAEVALAIDATDLVPVMNADGVVRVAEEDR